MMHFVIDSYGCDCTRIDSLRDVYEVILKLEKEFQLEPIMPPQLVPYYHCENQEDVGISAFTLLKGGHFTIHTFPRWGCYFADLLCDSKFIDSSKLKAFLTREFPASDFFIKFIIREDFDKNNMGDYTTQDFGPHYMITSKIPEDAPAPTIETYSLMLDGLPPRADMHPITRPVVLYDNVTNPSFLSGIILIAESHIAIHYNIKTREVMMDIFSCKRVDEQKYKEIVMDLFNGHYQDVLIRRGRRNIGRLETSETRNERYRYWQETINQK